MAEKGRNRFYHISVRLWSALTFVCTIAEKDIFNLLCDKVCLLLVQGWWYSSDSSAIKTGYQCTL